jgi:ferrous iron transport protein B
MLFVMTFFGAIVAIPIAWLFKRTLFKGETPPFVMELPSYKRPSVGIVLHRVYDRASAFVKQAGTLILATSILIWVVSYLPNSHAVEDQIVNETRQVELKLVKLDDERAPENDGRRAELAGQLSELNDRQNQVKQQLLTSSYLGQFGTLIEPAVKPLGWDWRIGIGVLASFPAREVIVSTLGTIYSLGGDVDETNAGLQSALRSATWPDGRPIYSIPVALSIMVFFALCAQCASTLMIIRRETNHWGWAVFTFGYMTLLAYAAAWLTFTVSSHLVYA